MTEVFAQDTLNTQGSFSINKYVSIHVGKVFDGGTQSYQYVFSKNKSFRWNKSYNGVEWFYYREFFEYHYLGDTLFIFYKHRDCLNSRAQVIRKWEKPLFTACDTIIRTVIHLDIEFWHRPLDEFTKVMIRKKSSLSQDERIDIIAKALCKVYGSPFHGYFVKDDKIVEREYLCE